MSEPRLCYVDGPWAFFTTRNLKDQWGDDWEDAPYEHNAGDPYEYSDYDRKSGVEPWEITKVAWEGPLEQPRDLCSHNSQWSVQQINAGAVVWLGSPSWEDRKVYVPAGTPLRLFCELVRATGGKVYMEVAS